MASSDDSDYEDARQSSNDEDPSPPPRPQNVPGHREDEEGDEEGVQQMQVAEPVEEDRRNLNINLNAQEIENNGGPGGLNAHEIVRQVIDNLWPVLGHPVADEYDDADDDGNDGMENVDNGYFDEEENGVPDESDENSPLNENDGNESDDEVPPADFDMQLPARHAYLGEAMEELQGRVVFDDNGPTPEIPLIVMGIQLVPGQTLPLTIFHAVFQNAIRRCVMTDKVFGIVHNDMDVTTGSMVYRGAFGTIAEIYEFQEENEHEPQNAHNGLTTFALKAKGRQRFNVISCRRQADGNLMGTVRVRPEIRLAPLVEAMFEQTHRFRFPVKRPNDDDTEDKNMAPSALEPTRKLAKTLSLTSNSSKGEEGTDEKAAIDAELAQMREKILKQRKRTKYYSALTPFPYFVYEQYEEPVLVERIHRKLRVELKGLTESGSIIPQDATELSFWLAQNLTMDDHHRIKILKMDNAVQRLRYELELLSRACKVITCRNCSTVIAESSDIFSMSVEGPQGTYVNPQGFVHETLTVHKISKDVLLKGHSSTEASWFPGYSWTIAECRRCYHHLGWKFRAVGRLKPHKFWGLARRSISFKYSFLTAEEAAEALTPETPDLPTSGQDTVTATPV